MGFIEIVRHRHRLRIRIFSLVLIFVSFSIQAQFPGGYNTGLRFWIKSTAGTYSNAGTNLCTNNTAVQQWNDQSGNAYNASQATASLRPTYFTNQSNGNPSVRFAGTHFLDATSTVNISGTSDYCGFFVVKLTSATAGGTTDGSGDYVLDRTTATNELYSMKVVSSGGTNRFFYQKRNNSGGNLGGPTSTTTIDNTGFQIVSMTRIYNTASNTESRIYVNGVLENTQSNASETTVPPQMRIGRHATNTTGGMNGDLTEIIIYNNDPSTTNRQRIESYLAIKYGISLNQSTLRNYTSSGGSIVYPATTTHSAYVTTITGIAQDNGSGLLQTNSKNQSSNDYIRMQNPSAMSDGDFLLWGSNNGSMTTPNTVDVDGVTVKRRLSRVWRIARTNDPGTVDVSIDLSAVPGSKVSADLRLLIDRDGDGFFDNDVAPLTGTLSGSTFSVNGVTFQHGDFFTVGTVNSVSTPLPIKLTELAARCENDINRVYWSTQSEFKSDYFAVESATDSRPFEELGRVKAAVYSHDLKQYSYTDAQPAKNEKVYYRLRQQDLDGEFTYYGPVLNESCPDPDKDILIYPNPSHGLLNVYQKGYQSVVVILDVFGNEVKRLETNPGVSSSADLNDLPKGVYYLRFTRGNKSELMKLCLY